MRCADCGVELVHGPTSDSSRNAGSAAIPGDPNEDPFCSFWKGEDPRIHADLCEVLDEAGIPHNTVFRRDHLFNLRNYPSYEVGVPFSLFEKAELAVKEAYGTESGEDRETQNAPRLLEERPASIRKLPVAMTPPEAENIPGPPTAGEEDGWYLEDAKVLVWNGLDRKTGAFLVAAMHENGIRCRLDVSADAAKLYVLADDAYLAGEIVREVLEA